LKLVDTGRWTTGGQSEQNIVKCSWQSGKMLYATRGGVNNATGVRASEGVSTLES
jgi:hypothetical protein